MLKKISNIKPQLLIAGIFILFLLAALVKAPDLDASSNQPASNQPASKQPALQQLSSKQLAQATGIKCGLPCNPTILTPVPALVFCEPGLVCLPNPNASAAATDLGMCVNQINNSCTYGNPCCSSITPQPTQGPFPTNPDGSLPEECLECDINGDGIISEDDLRDLHEDPTKQEFIDKCITQCPFTHPEEPEEGVLGDCSGPQQGVPDGVTNLRDVEQLRKELTGEFTTLACDFDHNATVDIIDFTNYLRLGFNRDQIQPTQIQPTAQAPIRQR